LNMMELLSQHMMTSPEVVMYHPIHVLLLDLRRDRAAVPP